VSTPIRIGILGAAAIAPTALIKPARDNPEVTVAAVAARDFAKAAQFAAKHGIERVHASYQDLIDDPDLNAVYIPLPNSLHGTWTRAAIKAGKHVLVEKPITANAVEASQIQQAATNTVVMEAFHYRYHPIFRRVCALLETGQYGELKHIDANFCVPLPIPTNIRYDYSLAGGALMDAGCYAVHMARTVGQLQKPGEPVVVSAFSKTYKENIDRYTKAELEFPAGHTATIQAALFSARVLDVRLNIELEDAAIHLLNPLAPQLYHKLAITHNGERIIEHGTRRSTYAYQLDAFANAVLRGTPVETGTVDGLANMRVIDAIYQAASLPIRQPSS
jgi:predicted dehydrogenase